MRCSRAEAWNPGRNMSVRMKMPLVKSLHRFKSIFLLCKKQYVFRSQTVKLLLNRGAPQLKDVNGNTPLHMACIRDDATKCSSRIKMQLCSNVNIENSSPTKYQPYGFASFSHRCWFDFYFDADQNSACHVMQPCRSDPDPDSRVFIADPDPDWSKNYENLEPDSQTCQHHHLTLLYILKYYNLFIYAKIAHCNNNIVASAVVRLLCSISLNTVLTFMWVRTDTMH